MVINNEKCIQLLFFLMIGLVGYIVLAIGFIAIAFQKSFKLYNAKLDYLKELLIEIKDNKKKKKNKKKE
jgi:hypothetical protein